VFVSGATGFDYSTMMISGDIVEQTEQCLRNIESALQQAGASMKDVPLTNFEWAIEKDRVVSSARRDANTADWRYGSSAFTLRSCERVSCHLKWRIATSRLAHLPPTPHPVAAARNGDLPVRRSFSGQSAVLASRLRKRRSDP
jgi:hypothetical protein